MNIEALIISADIALHLEVDITNTFIAVCNKIFKLFVEQHFLETKSFFDTVMYHSQTPCSVSVIGLFANHLQLCYQQQQHTYRSMLALALVGRAWGV